MTVIKHLLSFILGFFFCFIVLMVFVFGQQTFFNSRTSEDRLFNSEDWRSGKNLNERFQMIKDLEYYYLSKGMSLGELSDLLGNPDLKEGDSVIGFSIGSSGIFAFNQTLVFKLDDKMVIEDFRIE